MGLINRKANFWIRLLATIIDLLIFIAFAISSSFLVFNYKLGEYINKWNYYVWLTLLILMLNIFWIIIPILFQGQTIGMMICKIKIIPQEAKTKLSRAIFDRQRLFAFTWMIIFALFIIFVSPELFIKAAKINRNSGKLETLERVFVLIPTALASFATFAEIFLVISNVKESRIGINDNLSNTYTVWKNRFDKSEEIQEIKAIIKPKIRELPNLKYEN
ncbi:RDD family protein [Mycoplasma phocoeninasale]|uniref:RDD family protein n=2 Tax=Mycoplasma phocoeninasale TaxID=2726117 RepID=A0A858U351_9MOLU|nr:RDD family protein [Mycoplasma phocoeninasale]